MILYRPVGLQELALIYDSDMKAFPARLSQQPIFYPVLQLEYARKTAAGWNAKNGQLAGYVTQFKVEDEYIGRFEKHTVGKSQNQELWIPAEELEEFNRHIVGHIKVVEAHFGDAFEGFVPDQFALQGKNAVEQFTLLANSYLYQRMDFYRELKRNHKAVFLNYPFWQKYEFKNPGLKEKILQAIKEAWFTSFPKIPLPLPVPDDTPLGKQTDAQARALVDPVREDITLVEQPDADAEFWVDPMEENDTSEKQADEDAPSVVKPVRENINFVKKTDAHTNSLPNPVHKDVPSIEQTYANSLIHPVDEDVTPVEQTDSHSLINSGEEDITSVEQTHSDSQTNHVHKPIKPAEGTNAHFFVQPLREETSLPRQTDSHVVQGIKLGLSGRYHGAIDELSQAVEEDPGDVVAHTSLGVAFHRVGQDDRALACYEAALRIDPKYAEAHYFRANILYSQGNVREAIAEYTLAIGLKPELIGVHEEPAPQDQLTDYTGAPAEMVWIAKPARRILNLKQSLEANPRQADVLKERAAEYSRLWNYEQAIADYNSCLAIQPEDASTLHLRGVAYEQLGQLDRALEDYQQAIAINPGLSDEYINRGITFGRMGNLRQSIASLNEGIRLAPQNPDGYFNRGTSYFQLGDWERAIADFSKVIQLSSNDEAAYYWRGLSHEGAGHPHEAIADYRQFLALSQDEAAREEIEQRLSQWDEGKRNSLGTARDWLSKIGSYMSTRIGAAEDRTKTEQVPPEAPDQNLDLYGLITALGERALNSIWLGSGVECYGETAEELYSFTDQDSLIEGHDFLYITSGIRQTIKGDFLAFDQGAASHWLLIRAWDGSGFYIEINDPGSKQRLKTQFQAAEEVEGASPPYEGLFIRI